jgi:hypothetical protein
MPVRGQPRCSRAALGSLRASRSPALLAAFIGVAGALPATAQAGLSGSESFVVEARVLVQGADLLTATTTSAEAGLAPVAATTSVSNQYAFTGGVSAGAPGLGSVTPQVFGFAQATAGEDGGSADRLLGLGLSQLGGVQAVLLDGAAASNLFVLGDTAIDLVTPSGATALFNPKGSVGVEVVGAGANATRADGFRYLPDLYSGDVARRGEDYQITLLSEPDAVIGLFLGNGLPSVQFLLFPYGTVELLTFPELLSGFLFSPTGAFTYHLPVPDDPTLTGLTAEFQAIAITDPFTPVGDFTPRFTTVIQ